MKKLTEFIRYFDCRYGRTYAEAASELKVSTRTIRRYFERVEEHYPGLSVERFYGEGSEQRLRLSPRSPLCSSMSSQDVLTLHALHSAARLLQHTGRDDVAERLLCHAGSLMSRLPQVTHREVKTQVNRLLEAEVFAPTPAPGGCAPQGSSMRREMLERLRLAAATCRSVHLVMADKSIVAGIKKMLYTDKDMIVSLRTNGEEISVFLSDIKDVRGIDDLLLGLFAA